MVGRRDRRARARDARPLRRQLGVDDPQDAAEQADPRGLLRADGARRLGQHLRGRDAAPDRRGPHRPSRPPRPADRSRQPHAVRRTAAGGDPQGSRLLGPRRRPRPLQAGERHSWPPRRRPAPQGGGGPVAGRGRRGRSCRPLRRRRVRSPAHERLARRRRRGRLADRRHTGRAVLGRGAPDSPSARASASPSRAAVRPPTNSSRRPTSPSIA